MNHRVIFFKKGKLKKIISSKEAFFMKRIFILLLTACLLLVACSKENNELEGKTLGVFMMSPTIDIKKDLTDITPMPTLYLNSKILKK